MAAPDFRLCEVITRPQRTFTVDAVDYNSVWNTLHNPLVYQIGLFGDIVDSVDNTITGGADLYLHSAAIAATYTVGDKIYLYSTSLTGYSSGHYTVTNVSGNYITIDATYTGNVTGTAYITNFNLKRNLKIEIELWAIDPYVDTLIPYLIATSRYSYTISTAFANYGQLIINADVSGFMQGVLKKVQDRISYSPTLVNEEDIYNYSYFYIKYRETYIDSVDVFINDPADISPGIVHEDPNTCYVSKSVKQLQDLNGGSLFEYETFDDLRVPNAKFISGFSRPKYYGVNYPMDISYISSLIMFDDSNFKAILTPYTAAGVAGTPLELTLDIYSVPSFQRLIINLPFGDEGDWDNAAYFKIEIGTSTTDIYIDAIYVDIENSLNFCNPVYLKAKNDLGCWDYFMFQRNQDVIQESAAGEVFNPYSNSLEYDNTNSDYLSKLTRNSMVVGANGLSTNDFNAYASLARSPKVYMLNNSESPWQWKTVKLRGNTIKRNTRQSTFDCEFTLEFPDTYNLSS